MAKEVQFSDDELVEGVRQCMKSGLWKQCLEAYAIQPSYSLLNYCRMFAQTGGRMELPFGGCRSFWNKIRRFVKRGEKARYVLAPKQITVKREVVKTDEQGNPVLDSDGNPIKEIKKERQTVPGKYILVPVFTADQTEGEPIPSLQPEQLTDSVENFDELQKAIQKVSPLPIRFDKLENGCNGLCDHLKGEICISDNLPSESQTIETMIHEVTHARMHSDLENRLPRKVREIEAESVAHIVCKSLGIDTSSFTYPYITQWSMEEEPKTLLTFMNDIQKESKEILKELEPFLRVYNLKKDIDSSVLEGKHGLDKKQRAVKESDQDKVQPLDEERVIPSKVETCL